MSRNCTVWTMTHVVVRNGRVNDHAEKLHLPAIVENAARNAKPAKPGATCHCRCRRCNLRHFHCLQSLSLTITGMSTTLLTPDEPAQKGHHPRRNTATVKPSQFSADEHDMNKNGHVNNRVQELDTPTTTCTTGTSSTWSKYCNCGTFTVISTVTTRHQSLYKNGT